MHTRTHIFGEELYFKNVEIIIQSHFLIRNFSAAHCILHAFYGEFQDSKEI